MTNFAVCMSPLITLNVLDCGTFIQQLKRVLSPVTLHVRCVFMYLKHYEYYVLGHSKYDAFCLRWL
jgi:hypothetical protein